jgi:hypothetical protein
VFVSDFRANEIQGKERLFSAPSPVLNKEHFCDRLFYIILASKAAALENSRVYLYAFLLSHYALYFKNIKLFLSLNHNVTDFKVHLCITVFF